MTHLLEIVHGQESSQNTPDLLDHLSDVGVLRQQGHFGKSSGPKLIGRSSPRERVTTFTPAGISGVQEDDTISTGI